MHVSILSIIFMGLSAILSIGAPVVLFIIFHKKYKAPVLPMIVGAAAFIIFALILEQSVHLIVLKRFALIEKPFLYMLYGTLMAGIFEETARFLSFHILKRKYRGIGTGLSYGAGHGGIEAVLVAGLAMINAIVSSIMINSGSVETITGKLQGPALEQANAQLTALITTAPYLFLIGGLERIFAIGIQMSLSVMVFYAVFSKGKWWLYPLAILLHAIIDAPAALTQAGVIKNVLFVEGIVCISCVLILLLARYIHTRLRQNDLPE
ncbi:putative membrane protein YhfC [Spirochaetia bacterium]|nr:putative membrane protein YhfC [Spirochaetia bacterium]